MKKLTVLMLIAVSALFAIEKGIDVRYERTKADQMVLDFNVEKYSIGTVEKDGVTYSVIDHNGRVMTSDKGFAKVPRYTASVQLKDDRNVDLKYSAENFVEYKLDHPLLPSRGVISRSQDPSVIPYEIAPESVTDSWYPVNIAENIDPYIMRDVRGTTVIVHPFQYNAEKQILRVYENLTVTLTDNYDIPDNPLVRRTNKVAPEMSGMYKSLFLNYNETKAMEIGESGEILLVYTSDNGGITPLEPWIQWKEEMGYTVNTLEVASGTDLDATGDIQTEYDANPNILYVQLVGDWEHLKSKFDNSVTSTSGSQDPMLGCVVGTDQYIDLMVGRFSADSSTDVTTQVDKAINYEKNPDLGASWYHTGLGLARLEGGSGADDGEDDDQHQEYVRDRLLSFNYQTVHREYDGGSSFVTSDATATSISADINNGVSILNYINHGIQDGWSVGSYDNTDVDNLTNGSKLPVITSVACLVGQLSWSSGECFAEHWLRKSGGGAVVGNFSSISQPWAPPMSGQDYFNDILIGGYDYNSLPGSGIIINEQRTTFGAIACNATNLMLEENPSDAATKDTQEAWNIFGDVTLQVRNDTPLLIDNSTTTILIGNYSTTITSGGSSVEGARVTLYKDGVNYSGVTDVNGNVSIDHGFITGDSVTLTVTGYNLETEQSVQMVTGDIGGTFSLDHYSRDYGSVTAGNSSTLQFTITNSHSTETITGDITTITGYTVSAAAKKEDIKTVKNVLSYGVAPNSTKTFDLTFEPTAAGTYNGDITITSSDTNHSTEYIAVTGTGIAPDINLNPVSISANANPETETIEYFDVENTDTGQLDYSMTINYTSKVAKASGGPDTFGYKWKDSDEADGPTFSWVEINTSGTALGLGDDGVASSIGLGFTFNYYGVDYTTINIGANGAASFGSTSISYSNASIPGSGLNTLLAPFWDDLNPSSGGEIYYYSDTANGRFIIEWDGVVDYGATTPNTFQIILYDSGKIVYQYLDMQGVLNECTVGIEDHTGADGNLVTYNTAYLKNNLAIQFQATPEWLSLNPISGSINGVGSDQIAATCSAVGLDLGTYTADIIIASNDPDESTKTLPVTFNVAENSGGTFSMNVSSLDYGNVTVGYTVTEQFTITNSHADETITGDITTVTGYSVSEASKADIEIKWEKNTLPYTVGPNSSKTFDLDFDPSAAGTYNGDITITSSDTNHSTEYITVTGTGVVPDITVSEPDTLVISAPPGNSGNSTFDIGNVDLGQLDYSMTVNYIGTKASGGPDTFGYTWEDSDEPTGPTYNWIDISGTGTQAASWTPTSTYAGEDEGYAGPYPLGFDINYYGTKYDQVYLNSNGFITFTEPTASSITNYTIPTAGSPFDCIVSPFWDDLDGSSQGAVYYEQQGDDFVIQYDNWPDYGSTTGNTFQIVLRSSGKIIFLYETMNGDLTGCTVGIESPDGSDGSLVVYNSAYLTNGLAVEFDPNTFPEWLSLSPLSGSVAPSESIQITATGDAADLTYGNYYADITVASNDPDEATYVLPVKFSVSDMVNAPANVSTVTATDTTVDLSWDAVTGATIYNIYRSTTDPYSGFSYYDSTTGTTYQDTDVSTGNKYFYYITSDNAR